MLKLKTSKRILHIGVAQGLELEILEAFLALNYDILSIASIEEAEAIDPHVVDLVFVSQSAIELGKRCHMSMKDSPRTDDVPFVFMHLPQVLRHDQGVYDGEGLELIEVLDKVETLIGLPSMSEVLDQRSEQQLAAAQLSIAHLESQKTEYQQKMKSLQNQVVDLKEKYDAVAHDLETHFRPKVKEVYEKEQELTQLAMRLAQVTAEKDVLVDQLQKVKLELKATQKDLVTTKALAAKMKDVLGKAAGLLS